MKPRANVWRYDSLKTDPETRARERAETIAAIAARCEGPDQFENVDRGVRASLSVSKQALLKEEAPLKKSRARRRVKGANEHATQGL
jgi:hypothetical protein